MVDSNSRKYVENFKECVDIMKKNLEMSNTVEEDRQLTTALKIMEYFEEKYSCSGVCKTGLFYASRHIKHGKPVEACLNDF